MITISLIRLFLYIAELQKLLHPRPVPRPTVRLSQTLLARPIPATPPPEPPVGSVEFLLFVGNKNDALDVCSFARLQ